MKESVLASMTAVEQKKVDREKELWDRIAEEGKVLLTPGFDMHFKEPGFFRVCYAWVPPGSLPLAVSRIKGILDQVEASKEERI